MKLENAGRMCGCLLAEIRQGTANKIWLDQFKQRHLRVKDGDPIGVEKMQPAEAQKVELKVPADFSTQRDTARFVGKPVARGEKTALYTLAGDARVFEVGPVVPRGIVTIVANTEIVISRTEGEESPITYKDIGGLKREIRLIREVVEYPLRYPELFEHLGIPRAKGVILYGPPGTGKTLIARALANEVGAKFYSVSGPEIYSMWYGESEKKLRDIFSEAQKNAPAILVIDELDSLAPKRDKTFGEVERRVVATLLALMDGLAQLKGVIVVGTTNRVNSIDAALRREGRFGLNVSIGAPDTEGRKEILGIRTRRMPLGADVSLETTAQRTVGYVGADITSLCREAAYNALRRLFSADSLERGQIANYEGLEIIQSDFDGALRTTAPSALKEFSIEIPELSWEDIGGMEEVKRLLIENIAFAITKPDVFRKVGVKPAKGMLLYGPPGTGKTLLAKAVARGCGANFISVKGPEIRSKWFGESEERVRFLFAKAREVAPCVVFFDEIDSAAPRRGRDPTGVTDTIVNQLLSEMDGIESTEGVFVIGATNRLELLDPAVLRPGRFDYHIEVPLPDEAARRAILNIHLKNKPLASDVDLEELAKLTPGFSGAEIGEACREAAWDAIRDAGFEAERVTVTMAHIKKAVGKIHQTRDKLETAQNPSTEGGAQWG
ncbi:MAG: AAA family ATPase [Chloroflexi bacterium]|nr:AAA family ATPase [Chloroflexota bacterium]